MSSAARLTNSAKAKSSEACNRKIKNSLKYLNEQLDKVLNERLRDKDIDVAAGETLYSVLSDLHCAPSPFPRLDMVNGSGELIYELDAAIFGTNTITGVHSLYVIEAMVRVEEEHIRGIAERMGTLERIFHNLTLPMNGGEVREYWEQQVYCRYRAPMEPHHINIIPVVAGKSFSPAAMELVRVWNNISTMESLNDSTKFRVNIIGRPERHERWIKGKEMVFY